MFSKRHRDKSEASSSSSLNEPKLPQRRSPSRSEDDTHLTSTSDLPETSSYSAESKSLPPADLDFSPPPHESLATRTIDPGQKSRGELAGKRLDPPGITVLYEPGPEPVADIVFVHGLGGSSRGTWSKNGEARLFWPLEWLPLEPVISDSRILTFGYDADFKISFRASTISTISDFAKELLWQLRFARGAGGKCLDIGAAPLIFVAHSMGGLVVKKAVILGSNDANYKDIIDSISGVVFLSTPHRGANKADLLNNLLSACYPFASRKHYIAELKKSSDTIQEINDQFRNFSGMFKLTSFYETRPTPIGLGSTLILERETSSLGYPGEISKPLNADHRAPRSILSNVNLYYIGAFELTIRQLQDVCKFTDRADPNYTSIRGILMHLIEESKITAGLQPMTHHAEELESTANFLGSPELPFDDQQFFLDKRMEGTCDWLLEDPTVTTWWESTYTQPRLLWCTARPGSGKSVAASFLIGFFRGQNWPCVSYFFRAGDQVKNSLSIFLLSTALQIARLVPEYRQRLLQMSEDGFKVQKTAPKLLWQKLFVSTLLKVKMTRPLFVVFDGLDESESTPIILRMLADLADTGFPLRFLLMSRHTPPLSNSIGRLAKRIDVSQITLGNTGRDLEIYVKEEMEHMHGSQKFKDRTIKRILTKADGNFLWVQLVVSQILQCHTEDQVNDALNNVPPNLEPLYARMDKALANRSSTKDKALGLAILTWATCSRFPLTLAELAKALQPEHDRVLDLNYTIQQVCGEFVVVDRKDRLNMMHASARDFLLAERRLNYHVESEQAHQTIFAKCVGALRQTNVTGRFESHHERAFLTYAATSWPFHLKACKGWCDRNSLSLLTEFFRGHTVLDWIFFLACTNNMRTLVKASEAVRDFLKLSDNLDQDRSPLTHRLGDKDALSAWTHDLMRIIGKFAGRLVEHPKAIYRMVLGFCPQHSIIRKQFLPPNSAGSLVVRGAVNPDWDNCLARFTLADDSTPLKIIALDRYFVIFFADGRIRLYYSATLEEARSCNHAERILASCFSPSGDKFATYGLLRTKLWHVSTARQMETVENPKRTKALAMTFVNGDENILGFFDDQLIRVCNLTVLDKVWKPLGKPIGTASSQLRGANSPHKAVFSPNGALIAISHRGPPLSVWSVEGSSPRLVKQCIRPTGRGFENSTMLISQTHAQDLCWNPVTDHIVGIFNDQCVFKWHPTNDQFRRSDVKATSVACSTNGRFFVTASKDGALRVWDFNHFTPIYQLFYAASVTDLAVDQNESRIYDVRDRSCNIWQPNALLRLLEEDENETSSKETPSQDTLESEASVVNYKPVTALALNSQDSGYAVGDDGGSIHIFDCDGQKQHELPSQSMAIEELCWNRGGEFVASADLGRSVMVYQVMESGRRRPKRPAMTVLSVSEEDSVQQIFMDSNGSRLVLVTEHCLKIWSVDQRSLIATIPADCSYRWANSPTDPTIFLGFGPDHIKIMNWSQGLRLSDYELDKAAIVVAKTPSQRDTLHRHSSSTYPLSAAELRCRPGKVLVSPDGRLALIESCVKTGQGKKNEEHMLIDLDFLHDGRNNKPVSPRPLSPEIQKSMEIPLGFVASEPASFLGKHGPSKLGIYNPSGNVLVFLDKDYWICTSGVGPRGEGRIRRHFFLPRDWLNMELLEMAIVTVSGHILCPRNAEVAIIANGLVDEWDE